MVHDLSDIVSLIPDLHYLYDPRPVFDKKGGPVFDRKGRAETLSPLFNSVISSVYHRPKMKVGEVFAHALYRWAPPPRLALDPTCDGRQMYKFFKPCSPIEPCYKFIFGDIDHSVVASNPEVHQLDVRSLPKEWSSFFDLVVMDLPYRKKLSHEPKSKIRDYKGEQYFDLWGHLSKAAYEIARVLKPQGFCINKIGNNHSRAELHEERSSIAMRSTSGFFIEKWDHYSKNLFERAGLELRDEVIFQPYYIPGHAVKRKIPNGGVMSQPRHSYFQLYQKVINE